MQCRAHCGACCIAPSISSKIPGMPNGKKAGELCVQLDSQYQCKIFGQPERPKVCREFQAEPQICGNNRDEALYIIEQLEIDT
ncbi:YkgJ family cysteine cluster protein [Gayadomonas joobiniege]|uniref:YkgJ family cysteine cluster protein n=1 Tax=Gayadomonas joobiniege TaxID=1234606 RepID=UPI000381008A|nr:YkgJ family cysteine cluster protein [Gayadomonas joobiniege]